jgi:PucR C-terminal helix-turn-helix domain
VEPVRADLNALRQALIKAVPDMLDDVAAALREQWPSYAAFIPLARAEMVASGATAMGLIVDVAAEMREGRPAGGPLTEVAGPIFEQIGSNQARLGLSLAGLLAAYQAGARAAWRHMAGTAVASGAPAPEVALLAESVFWLVDHLSAASTRGYTEEQSHAAAQHERACAELAELLLSGRADLAAVDAAAQRARWPIPEAIAVVLLADEGRAVPVRPGVRSLTFHRGTLGGLLVAAPEGNAGRAALVAAFRGTGAVVGPAVPPAALPGTLELVEVALRLRRAGVLNGDPVFAGDHLDVVIVHRDPHLLDELSRDVLAPLDGLAPEARARMEQTLISWLHQLGDRAAMAAELHVHPQTVRYRMGQLRNLLGAGLDDPSVRRKLMLALCWRSSADG